MAVSIGFRYSKAILLQCTLNQRTLYPMIASAKTTRIATRLSPYVKEVIERAAQIEGRSVSDFVVEAARQAAERSLERAEMFKLCLEDQRAFAEAILNPPDPTDAMRQAFQAHGELITLSN